MRKPPARILGVQIHNLLQSIGATFVQTLLTMFSLPSMARGFGALLIITTVSEIMADRSTFEQQDFTASYPLSPIYRY